MERELIINSKKLKELVASALDIEYENLSFEFNNEENFTIEIKSGHFKEYIPFSDERILKAMNFKELNLELDYVLIHENDYAYRVDAKDEDLEYVFYCKEIEVKDESTNDR
ncbi:hypothetical protein N5U26_05360 [Aliarcobacter cryaerophilus]|uniref:hypothetical protein n=1 Tax=Aliarcobacter cryaerophilus TaxID=28198 RepID=UPI0021B58E79|nr:hypothetical protein [Aliarcobacter cryaerophilus]MCT7509773.1 hypothetical protein [Aliarcobacter cryaerophilus]